MNKCSVGDIIFGWFVGVRYKDFKYYGKNKYGIMIEVGDKIGNIDNLVDINNKVNEEFNLKLVEVIVSGRDIEEIREGVLKVYDYYKLEFNEDDSKKDKIINKLEKEHEKNSYSQCIVYAKKMSCVGVELMHKDDMELIINKNSMDNKEINNLKDDFVVIKLIERVFLKKFMNKKYSNEMKEQSKLLLIKNSVRLAFPISQLSEVVEYFNKDYLKD
jgi:hypothetical protein